jgi:glycosyltransferase involved in cell wall biosynthesis
MKSLRILQLFNRYLQYGGEEGSVLRIGDTLQERFDVGYFLSSSEEYVERGFLQKCKAPFMAIHNKKLISQIERCHKLGKYDIWQIHNTFPFMSPSVYAYAFRKGVPVIQFLHNYRMSCVNGYFLNHGMPCTSCIGGNFSRAALTGCWKESRLASAWGGLILSKMRMLDVFNRVAGWIALSPAQKEIHVSMGIPEHKIHIIPHFFIPDPKNFIGTKGCDVLFVGRLSAEKGVHQLLSAWKQVSPPQKSSLLFMGEGPEMGEMMRRVRDEKIPNVEFLGFVRKNLQHDVWKRSAFAVIPSIWEDPLPTVVFEAWERGRSVIVSDMGGNRQTVDHDLDGLKFSASDPSQLADAISSLLLSPLENERIASNGLKKLCALHGKDLWMHRMTEVYNRILE